MVSTAQNLRPIKAQIYSTNQHTTSSTVFRVISLQTSAQKMIPGELKPYDLDGPGLPNAVRTCSCLQVVLQTTSHARYSSILLSNLRIKVAVEEDDGVGAKEIEACSSGLGAGGHSTTDAHRGAVHLRRKTNVSWSAMKRLMLENRSSPRTLPSSLCNRKRQDVHAVVRTSRS